MISIEGASALTQKSQKHLNKQKIIYLRFYLTMTSTLSNFDINLSHIDVQYDSFTLTPLPWYKLKGESEKKKKKKE